jgi:hypothetical protein
MRLIPTAWLAATLLSPALFAQSVSTSQIAGTVQDSTGLPIPGAQVTVTETDTGGTRSAQTDAAGSYILPNLPSGPYRLEVKKDGFSTYVQSGIILQVSSNPTIDVALKVGSVNEQVVVEAAAAMVETHSTGVGQVVDQARVVDLPLNGRNATDLIYLAGASATAPNADLVSAKNYPGEAPISVAGGLATGTTYLLDGGEFNDSLNNLNLPLPFPDALQEFKVETSALPAQYGEHSGGAVNAITRSGSNEFHGGAFEFVRNYIFNARNSLAPSRDSLKRNQFGGELGGPIKKDKLFFFLGYQGTLIRSNPSQSFSFEPTPQMLSGDFSTIASPTCNSGKQINIKDPLNGGALFPGNQIPTSLFNASALKMMSFFPPTSDPCGKVFFGILSNQDEHQGLAKVDYQLSTKQTMYLRYFVTHSLQPSPFNGDPLTETLAGANDLVNSGVFGHTFVVSPNMVNSFHVTFNRSAVTKFQAPSFDASTLGIDMTTLVPGHIVASVSNALYSSTVFSYASLDPTQSFQLSDDYSIIKGSHQLQFGVNWIHYIDNVYGPLFGDGFFSFTGQTTGLPMADFLLGDAASFTQANLQFDDNRYNYLGLYAQDSWKVNSRMTVNLGLRWEPYFGGSLPRGEVTHFDPALFAAGVHSGVYPNAPAGLQFPGDPGFNTGNRPSFTSWNDWAPRAGLVWDPQGKGKMTIRASWGMFYDLPQTLFGYGFVEEPPWGESISQTNVNFSNPWANYPGGNPFPISLNKNFTFPNFGTYANYPLNLKVTYLEQWNVTLERQFGSNWLASASYLGNNTIHLWTNDPINAPVFMGLGACTINGIAYPVCSTTANENQRRPLYLQNPAQGKYYGAIDQLAPTGTASYNALLLSLQHRLSNHFTVLANYTYSHCITDPFVSELDSTASQYTDPTDRRFDRGNCLGIDHRHNFNLSGVAESPNFSERWLEDVAGHWRLSLSIRAETGSYFSITTGTDTTLTGTGAPRPNQILGDPYCANPIPSCWINPKAFSTISGPLLGSLGNVGSGTLLGPGYLTVNVALSRLIYFHEHQSIELRGEAFNLLNNFSPGYAPAGVSTTTIATALNASNFGQVQIAADPRIMQFAVKYVF